jgi:hypothetical protein
MRDGFPNRSHKLLRLYQRILQSPAARAGERKKGIDQFLHLPCILDDALEVITPFLNQTFHCIFSIGSVKILR